MNAAPAPTPKPAPTPVPAPGATIDRADGRVRHDDGIAGELRAFLDRVRSGDLGMLPVIVGLLVITIAFTALNPVFIDPDNLVNLLFDCATVGLISLGVVFVLLLGEIDLSIGSMSGLASAIVGVLWVGAGWNVALAIPVALLVGAGVGLVYSELYSRFGMPSFIASLAGLLALLGLQLYLLGDTGSINLPYDAPLVALGQTLVMPDWLSLVLALLPGAAMLLTGLGERRRRLQARLSAKPIRVLALKSGAVTVLLLGATAYLDRGRGVPWLFAFFTVLVVAVEYALRRTRWGRSMFAVGGNREAARRSGINVRGIHRSAFVLCATFAAAGGVLSAARLASASRQAGTGDVNLNAIAAAVIGGTSLFGGRGSAYSALLGVIVIQAISNGLTLLNLSSSLRYMITGGVLAVAVIVDSLARRSRASHGRA